jgi:hypothetical protein
LGRKALLVCATKANVSLPRSIALDKAKLSEDEIATLQVFVACKPTVRGNPVASTSQRKAAENVAKLCLSLQSRCVSELLSPASRSTSSSTPGTLLVHVLAHEWDETSQRFRQLRKAAGTSSSAKRAMQIMVQHGSVHSFRGDCADELQHIKHPVFIRAMVLEEQKT